MNERGMRQSAAVSTGRGINAAICDLQPWSRAKPSAASCRTRARGGNIHAIHTFCVGMVMLPRFANCQLSIYDSGIHLRSPGMNAAVLPLYCSGCRPRSCRARTWRRSRGSSGWSRRCRLSTAGPAAPARHSPASPGKSRITNSDTENFDLDWKLETSLISNEFLSKGLL